MAVIGNAIYNKLTTDAGVTALIATRVYPVQAPQNPTYPLVTYRRIDGPRVVSGSAAPGITYPRFQFSCWAATQTAADALADAVRVAIQNWRATTAGVVVDGSFIENQIDLGRDPVVPAFQVAVDALIWYRE